MLEKFGLYNWLYSLVAGAVGAFPKVELPPDAMTVFDNITDYCAVIGHYIPLDIFLACSGIILAVWVICAIISAVLQLL
ncbi:hypothetical protein [Eubacterium limosum]|uniref:hypothetical protein n=1 Tax=Eubacterium limosum TaxID=1736 RepID=UPI0010631E85|nr:hypothetical protein [Eubacterium limosum]